MDDSLKRLRHVLLLAGALGLSGAAALAGAAEEGERIYRDGILASGDSLVGVREDGVRVQSAGAACVNCHHRSGLGASEGAVVVPPIIGRYLFQSSADIATQLDAPHLQGFLPARPAYTETTLARAIRQGIASDGRKLSYLMPRYPLADEAMATLSDYLRHLAERPAPGVEPDTLHFATIVTPEADPGERDAMVEVLEHFFAAHNALTPHSQRPSEPNSSAVYRIRRRWQLAVWTLAGPPDGWASQLAERFRADPVLAVISGIGGRDWQPVHRFCEAAGVACLLPNVSVPWVRENDFYPIYFSRGVFLEADLIARELAQRAPHAADSRARIVQIYREGTAGKDGADALRIRMGRHGPKVIMHALDEHAARSQLDGLIATIEADDALVLWLSASDLKALPTRPRGRAVFASGLLAGLENAPVPAPWRPITAITFPVELPDQRRLRVAFTLGWLRLQNIPPRAQRIQADTYLACQILSDALDSMVDSYLPDYLVERVETMMGSRLVNGYYPRLGLGTGQRFASKGGYVVRFVGPTGTEVRSDHGWIVP